MNKNLLFWAIIGISIFGILTMVFLSSQAKNLNPTGSVIQSNQQFSSQTETNNILEEEIMEEKNTIVLIETSKGNLKVQLFDAQAPITVDNFKKLVQEGFYDGTIFHRVIKEFMIQGGDPQGNGTGGPGYNIDDEFTPELRHNKKGILSMANAGPNTGGSQFFITLIPTPWLDDKHSIFGELIEGEDVLDTIGSVETGANDKPLEEIKVIKMLIVEN